MTSVFSRIFHLEDREWATIVHSSGLPDTARPDISTLVAHYRGCARAIETAGTPGATKQMLAASADNARNLAPVLAALAGNPLAIVVLTSALGPPDFGKAIQDKTAQRRLESMIAGLTQTAVWLEAAADQVADGRRGSHKKAILLAFLVKSLDDLFQKFKARRLNRSSKGRQTSRDFVTAVCKLADPTIGKGSIDEALRTIIKARRGGITTQSEV